MGLVAIRPPAASRFGRLVGSFSVNYGPRNLIAVLSVDERAGTAELIQSSIDPRRGRGLTIWAFAQGRAAPDRLEFRTESTGGLHSYRWQDDRGGGWTWQPNNFGAGYTPAMNSSSFVRLD